MSSESFKKFYDEYVPKDDALRERIDDITNEDEFVKVALEEGKKAGFDFSADEVHRVMKASEQAILKGELSDGDLDQVAGGALSLSTSTVEIRSVSSLSNLQTRSTSPTNFDAGAMTSTVMCCW